MLIVFSKEKILSYFIAFSTVALLLCLSTANTQNQNTIETSSNKTGYNNVVSQNIIVDAE